MNRVKTFSMTDVGKRRSMNQDYFFTSEVPVGNLPNLFIVADGMGGYKGGEIASSLAVKSVKNFVFNNFKKYRKDRESILQLLKAAIEYANMVVYDKSKEDEWILD